MAKVARTPRAGVSYVALATAGRGPIFEISRVASLLIETLLHYRTLGHYKLHAYVVLPDHVHIMLTPQGITLDQALGLIRTGFVHRLDSELPVWEEKFTAYSITNMHDLEVVRAHIHQIPVHARLVDAPQFYPHSSAYRQAFVLLGSHPVTSPPADSSRELGAKPAKSTATSLKKVAS